MAGKQPAVRRKGQDPKRFDMAVTVSVILCVMAAAMAAVGGHIYESRGQPEVLQVDMIIEETSMVSQRDSGEEILSEPGYVQTETTAREAAPAEAAAHEAAPEKTVYTTAVKDTATETAAAVIYETAVGVAVININTASAQELESLNGIGEKLAQAIIDYRNVKPFDTIEEIMQVKGIGEKKFEKIKDSITC